MTLVLLVSIAVRVAAVVWSVVLLRRLRDWRMGFVTALVALMTLRQVLTLVTEAPSWTLRSTATLTELPGLAVSVLTFLAVIALERILTARTRAEERLRLSEERYRTLVRGALYGIYRSTEAGTLVMVNPALARMLGYSHDDELVRLGEAGLYADPADRARLVEQYRERETVEGVEIRWRHKDGRPLVVRLSGRPVRGPNGAFEGFEMVVENVTERRQLERQLRQAQKMEAIGQLTGGVAHDFNNLLTVIMANAELVTGALQPDQGEARADLDELIAAARRGSTMVRKLLAFSRRELLTRRRLDLTKIAADAATMLRRILPEHIEIRAPESAPVWVEADPGAIEQMLINLATNARDAMPAGGVLEFTTGVAHLDEDTRAANPQLTPAPYARVAVRDTGVGMDDHTMAKVFEPFFTTKPPGMGTGLGMAMTFGLMQQHGGHVDVASERGIGTTVSLYFPIALDAASGPVLAQTTSQLTGRAETT